MELISDRSGSISFGWVSAGVYLVRATGDISASLGALQLHRLEAALEGQEQVHYFSDGRGLRSYDLMARGAFTQMILAQRKKFAELVMLTWSEGLSEARSTFSGAIGHPLVLLSSASEFDRRLYMAAPRVREALTSASDSARLSAL